MGRQLVPERNLVYLINKLLAKILVFPDLLRPLPNGASPDVPGNVYTITGGPMRRFKSTFGIIVGNTSDMNCNIGL